MNSWHFVEISYITKWEIWFLLNVDFSSFNTGHDLPKKQKYHSLLHYSHYAKTVDWNIMVKQSAQLKQITIFCHLTNLPPRLIK